MDRLIRREALGMLAVCPHFTITDCGCNHFEISIHGIQIALYDVTNGRRYINPRIPATILTVLIAGAAILIAR